MFPLYKTIQNQQHRSVTIRLEDSLTHLIPYSDVTLSNTVVYLVEYVTKEVQNVTLPNPCITVIPDQGKTLLDVRLRMCFPSVKLFTTYILFSAAPLFQLGVRTYIDDFMTYVRIQGSERMKEI